MVLPQVAKIANNLVLAISMVAVAEGMNLGVKLGMDPKKLAGIFNTSSARCWSSDTYNPCPGVGRWASQRSFSLYYDQQDDRHRRHTVRV